MRSSARAAGNRAAAWLAVTPAANPPVRPCGTFSGSYVTVEQAQQGKPIIFEGPDGVGESTLSFEAMCIYWYLSVINANTKPFVWAQPADRILVDLTRSGQYALQPGY